MINGLNNNKELILEVLEKSTGRGAEDEVSSSVSTGFYDLDYLIGGFERGAVMLLAGKESDDITAFTLNVARNIAGDGLKVAYFNLYDSCKDIMTKLLSIESKLETKSIAEGKLSLKEFELLTKSACLVSELPLWIFNETDSSMDGIKEDCIDLMDEKGLGLIIVDNFQNIPLSSSYNFGSVEEDKMRVWSMLRKISVKANCPILVLYEIRERMTLWKEGRLDITDLKESDGFLSKLDVIMFLTHNDKKGQSEDDGTDIFNLVVAKNRLGKEGVVKLRSHMEYSKFESLD